MSLRVKRDPKAGLSGSEIKSETEIAPRKNLSAKVLGNETSPQARPDHQRAVEYNKVGQWL
jgi:hypothetical protein